MTSREPSGGLTLANRKAFAPLAIAAFWGERFSR